MNNSILHSLSYRNGSTKNYNNNPRKKENRFSTKVFLSIFCERNEQQNQIYWCIIGLKKWFINQNDKYEVAYEMRNLVFTQ